jgi:hypothetical protein
MTARCSLAVISAHALGSSVTVASSTRLTVASIDRF